MAILRFIASKQGADFTNNNPIELVLPTPPRLGLACVP